MTGIYGWISLKSQNNTVQILDSMRDALPETGAGNKPVIKSRIALGVKSINPNSISNDSGNIFAAIDGYPEWKISDLKQYCITHGDAATILFAYHEYGVDFLKYIGGSFSLALFDSINNSLLLAIDRMGVFPLAYSKINNGLVFSSSLDAITKHPEVSLRINPQSVYNYIYFHFIPSPDTIYQDIYKLEPGTFLVHKNGTTSIKKYWVPHFTDDDTDSSYKDKNELLRLLTKAINKSNETRSAAFLSGGLDSSTISGLLAKSTKATVNTYSIGFSAEGYDEISYSRIASKHFKTESHEYYVTQDDIIDALPAVAQAYDEPFGNSSAIPALFCSRLAKSNGTHLMFAGDGGDEIFAGNERYAKQKLLELYKLIPLPVRKYALEPAFLGIPIIKSIPVLQKIHRYILQANKPIIERIEDESYNFFQDMTPDQIFCNEFLEKVDTEIPKNMLRKTYDEAPTSSFLNKMLYLDWKFTLADNDIRKVNQMCQISGINVRYPMLDDEVVEFSCTIPPELKLKGLKLRYFFKCAVEGFLPKQIINKPKHGFGLPFGVWLKSNKRLQDFVYSSLDELKHRNIIRARFIDDIIQTHRTGHAAYYGSMIWAFVMLEHWFQQHDIH